MEGDTCDSNSSEPVTIPKHVVGFYRAHVHTPFKSFDDFEIVEQHGSGAFGAVFQCIPKLGACQSVLPNGSSLCGTQSGA